MRYGLTLILTALILSACATGLQWPDMSRLPFDWQSVFGRLDKDLKQNRVLVGDPVYIRIFKEENILELWMKGADSAQYSLIKSYPICNWSGALGPKFAEGDRQAPEGFYDTSEMSLNPNSRYHLSFNIQYPNAYDRAHGRTGSFIMVHGDCVSDGCYAMTDKQIEEIYTLVERALAAGQRSVPVHVFPFKMTRERMFYEYKSPWFDFWMNLKEGYDYFEKNGVPPMWGLDKNLNYQFY